MCLRHCWIVLESGGAILLDNQWNSRQAMGLQGESVKPGILSEMACLRRHAGRRQRLSSERYCLSTSLLTWASRMVVAAMSELSGRCYGPAKQVSPRSYHAHGHSAILTAVDPLCAWTSDLQLMASSSVVQHMACARTEPYALRLQSMS